MQEQTSERREQIRSELNQALAFKRLAMSEDGQLFMDYLREMWQVRALEMTTIPEHDISQIHKGRCLEIADILRDLDESATRCIDLEAELNGNQTGEDFGIPTM